MLIGGFNSLLNKHISKTLFVMITMILIAFDFDLNQNNVHLWCFNGKFAYDLVRKQWIPQFDIFDVVFVIFSCKYFSIHLFINIFMILSSL